ncbi:hypothetical protein B0H66DRAFT_615234 [Apodospora peruviana]|uniref:Transmembrane protein n=1 Tax=Apodospora peruviana TaxID=516989 RepID=A0AAE0MBH0_9PEZI|nr:hypothetical protein B0H66DRAFT_615234 [Apodospora peruviana]
MNLNNSGIQNYPPVAEVDITDYSRRPGSSTESTDELLPSATHLELDESSRSVNTSGRTTPEIRPQSPVGKLASSIGPVHVLLVVAEPEKSDIASPYSRLSHPKLAQSAFGRPPRAGIEVSEDDIELEHFPLPAVGAYYHSTEHLVPLPDESEPKPSTPEDGRHDDSSKLEATHCITNTPVPNYKPLPLRWPFKVFLVAIIAGICAFLEYQIHDLPPLHYKALQYDPPERNLLVPGIPSGAAPARTTAISAVLVPTTLGTKPSPLPKVLPVVQTETHVQTGNLASESYLGGGAPTPAPRPRMVLAPRPPSSSYPGSQKQVTKFCGWNRPSWYVINIIPPEYLLEEFLQAFMTTDPSWCPCTVTEENADLHQFNTQWNTRQWETNDKGCESVMNVVASFNAYKSVVYYNDTPVGRRVVNMMTLYDTPPSFVTPFWQYPTTDADGGILFPVALRTPRLEKRDIFGNAAERTKTATFPISNQWSWADYKGGRMDTSYFTPCSTDFRDARIDMLTGRVYISELPSCTEEPPTFLTTWLTLPFGRPTKAPNTTSIESSTRTSIDTGPVESRKPTQDTKTGGFQAQSTLSTSTRIIATSSTVSVTRNATRISSGKGGDQDFNTWQSPNPIISTSPGNAEAEASSVSIPQVEVTSTQTFTSVQVSSDFDLIRCSEAHTTQGQTSSSLSIGTTFETPSSLPRPGNDSTKPSSPSSKFTGTESVTSTITGTVTQVILSTLGQSKPTMGPETKSAFNTPSLALSDSTSLTLSTFTTVANGGAGVGLETTTPKVSVTSVTSVTSATSATSVTPVTSISEAQSSIPAISSEDSPAQASPVGPIPPEAQEAFSNLRTEADYLMASLIPVLLATLLGICIQVFTSSLNTMLPFRLLGREHGAPASDSLCLPRSSWLGASCLTGYRFMRQFGDPLPSLSVLLNILSTVFVPLSTETIRLEFTTIECASGLVCAFGMRTSGVPVRAAEALLAAMAVLVISLRFILTRWKTGVAAEPWSIASMAGLLTDYKLRNILRSVSPSINGKHHHLRNSQIATALERRRFRLGFLPSTLGSPEHQMYGVQVAPATDDGRPIRPTVRDPPAPPHKKEDASRSWKKRFWHIEPATQELSIRTTALILTIGLLVLILYYENTVPITPTPFETFMDSQSFGVRMLFTAFGTAVSGFWDFYFSQMAEGQIHRRLLTAPLPAQRSVLVSPPSNVFTGLWHFFRAREILPFSVALATLLAKFTPILFSGIPFRNTVTWKMHEACTWMAVAVLSYMVLVLVVSLYCSVSITRKQLPVRTDTIAGCMYYLVGSGMLKDFEGLATLGGKERDRVVGEMSRLYRVFDEVGGERHGRGSQGGLSDSEEKGVVVDYYSVPAVTMSKS